MDDFTEKDAELAMKFVNFVFDKATYKLDSKDALEYHKYLSWYQQSLIPKIKANILEVKKVYEAPKPVKKSTAKKGK